MRRLNLTFIQILSVRAIAITLIIVNKLTLIRHYADYSIFHFNLN